MRKRALAVQQQRNPLIIIYQKKRERRERKEGVGLLRWLLLLHQLIGDDKSTSLKNNIARAEGGRGLAAAAAIGERWKGWVAVEKRTPSKNDSSESSSRWLIWCRSSCVFFDFPWEPTVVVPAKRVTQQRKWIPPSAFHNRSRIKNIYSRVCPLLLLFSRF